jgi:sterol desaturase/sphingolipid hydroxylase (fatty acid hydroxylase superfamily)
LSDPIAWSIPAFVAVMVAELAWSWRLGRLSGPRPTWRPIDALTDLGCGVFSQITGLVLGGVLFAGSYTWLYRTFALADLGTSLTTWLATFVVVDLLYYWWHRASHRVNLLWAAHVVHHQSEDFNLAVALRQGVFTPVTSLPFYAVLAIIGVPPVVFLTCSALNTVGQFWFHTRLIDRLGPLEWVLNTPSHHRVHHGINPGVIDRNHAGIFIVWDRLFGTFTPETSEPMYGVVTAHRTASVLRANLDPLADLVRLAARCRGLDRLRVWFAPPEWRPAHLGGPITIPEPSPTLRWQPDAPTALIVYATVGLVATSVALPILLLTPLPLPQRAAAAALILWTVAGWGALLDGAPGARAAEWARLAAAPAVAWWLHPGVGLAATVVSAVSAARLWTAPAAPAEASPTG